jgi:hypothetical protein
MMAEGKAEYNFRLHTEEEVLENEHPAAHKVGSIKEPSFQSYMMFILNGAYARLKADFQTMNQR